MLLYNYQRNVIRKFSCGGNFLLNGARRLGVTTILINYALKYATDYIDSKIAIVAPKYDLTEHIRESLAHSMYAAETNNTAVFDPNLRILSNNRNEITLNNGTVIDLLAGGTTRRKSENYDLLIMDNAGFIDIKKYLEVVSGNRIILGNTGGLSKTSDMHQIYLESLRGNNDFDTIYLPWDVWKNYPTEMKDQLGEMKWNQDAELLSY